MAYRMRTELLEQPQALRKTFEEESINMDRISKELKKVDRIYLIGCGSSLSTLYTVRDALGMVSDFPIIVTTGYEFTYSKNLGDQNAAAIFASQSGETADTLAGLKKANQLGFNTISISNEKDSSMIKEAKNPIITRGNKEEAILGTKTYVTQLACLYYLLFASSDYEKKDEIIKELNEIPDLIEELLKSTEEENKILAEKYKNEDIFYCLGGGPNFGLAYKLSMTMLMEGAIKHACPLYAAEFRHGLIERAEKDVPLIFLEAGYPVDELTEKAINFSKKLECKTIIYRLKDYANINNLLAPLVLVVPLEWFVYYLAHFNGEDPGSTRHIGKVRYE
ncbi:MAG: SIS domain-containing protein [Methanobacteriaceae archaeon]|nr:SIS domain-containing protein [Methanobacteriaceae archaeon]